MASVMTLLQLGGAVALLLFGLGLTRDGMTEAFGIRLRMALGVGTRSGPSAFLAGLVATLGLQSSTATALLTASFLDRDLIRGRMAQIVLLGANIGTALTAWIVSSGMAAVSPALMLAGYALSRRRGAVVIGIGRALMGVALMLVSLELLKHAAAPLRDSAGLAAFLPMLDSAWPVALLIAAGLAFLCSSSLAAVLLILSLTLPPALSVVMVLGANLGGAAMPVLLTRGLGAAARRLTWGNLGIRALGCLLALPFAGQIAAALQAAPLPASGLAVEAHLIFNLVLALAIWPFAGLITRALDHAVQDDEQEGEPGPRWLDESALQTPILALTGASREVLTVGDTVERMLNQTRLAFQESDPAPLAEVAALEDRVDRRQQEVKTYLSRLGNQASEDERRRAISILDYVINLEHVGDIIDKGLAPEVRKKIGLRLRFSPEGYAELERMFIMTQENLRMAQTVFLTRDRQTARRLIELKVEIRNLERHSAQRHLFRLREGLAQSRETSSLHLDILRDLKRINAHVAAVAHPILDEDGLLFESRLRRQ